MVIYLRVSTDRQAEHGQGLGVQETACRAWCKAQGRRVAGVHADEGVSGTAAALESRTGLAAALEQLRAGAGALLVYRLDRLARDMVLQEQLLAEITRAGAQLHSTSASEDAYLADDPDDPARALVRQVLGAVAAYDRAMVSLRMRLGRERKRAAGGYAGGRPPFGTRAARGELEEQPELADAVEIIRRGRRQGLSLREIALELRLAGIPTASGTGVWHPYQVARVLSRWQRHAK